MMLTDEQISSKIYDTTTAWNAAIRNLADEFSKACPIFKRFDVEAYDNLQAHSDICAELAEIYERKNKNYGDSFHQTFVLEGYTVARIRLTDKLNRFRTLTTAGPNADPDDESIRDTLLDLANYAIMTIMELDRGTDET